MISKDYGKRGTMNGSSVCECSDLKMDTSGVVGETNAGKLF